MRLRRKIGLGLLAVVVLGAAVSLTFLWRSGLWGIFFPSSAYETVAPQLSDDWGQNVRVRVLVFSKTNGFRHFDGIGGAAQLFERIGPDRDWAVYSSENSAVFSAEMLPRFDVVVFSNTTGNVMSEEQDRAFQTWLEAGGGWVGIHGAGDSSHKEWKWYQDNLIGPLFIGHPMAPQLQEGRVLVEDRRHPATRHLADEFQHREEWYSWDDSARSRGFNVLMRLDESSYSPVMPKGPGVELDLRMGDHPIAWWRCVGSGRALYSALGHEAITFDLPHVATMIEESVEWAAGNTGDGCDANPTATN